MIPVHVALIDESGEVDDLAGIGAAINEQVQADFAPIWKGYAEGATIGVYTDANVPVGCWAVRVKRTMDQPGALGYHSDQSNQPYAVVEATPSVSTTISHETLEMLADPFGNRVHSAALPAGTEDQHEQFGLPHPHTRVRYLLEVCDPPENKSYQVGGHALSDFVLPPWYRTNPASLLVYSHAGGCVEPREVADGGYVSFENPATGEWFQVFNVNGTLEVNDLGKFNSASYGSLREWTDHHARSHRGQG